MSALIENVPERLAEEPTSARRARELRLQLGLSQSQLARELNITPYAISHYECGRRPARRLYINYLKLRALAD